MATSAWAENSARKQLTALDEAVFIERTMRDFGWTQERVAERET